MPGGHLLSLQRLDGAAARVGPHRALKGPHSRPGARESKVYEDIVNGGRGRS